MFPQIVTGKNLELRTLAPTDENATLLSEALIKSETHRSKYLKQFWNYKCGASVKKQLASRQSSMNTEQEVNYGVFDIASGKLIGETSFIRENDYFACTVWIDSDFTGRGYMQETLHLSEIALFNSGHSKIVGYVNPDNTVSCHVFEKCKYKQTGKTNSYLIYEKTLASFLSETNR